MRIHYTLEGANGDTVNGQPVSTLHPLPVTGSFSAQTTAVATASPPTYGEGATASLSTDLNGNLRIAGTFSASVTDMLNKTGSVSSAAVLFTQADTTGYFSVSVQLTALAAASTVIAEISNDGSSWGVVPDALTGASSMIAAGEYVFPCPAKQFRVRQSVYGGSGTTSCNAQLRGAIFPGVPAGAATAARQDSIIAALGSPFQAGGSIGNSSFGISGTLPAFAATPTFNLGTLNGAATAAKQPALGTAGSASSDVLSVQGIASMTPLKVDASVATITVSGTVTANAGTNLNTSALALESGGNLATLASVLGAKTDAKSTATDSTSVSAMQVLKEISASVQAPPSQAVTNAGTFATQAAQSGTWTTDPSAVTPVLETALSTTVQTVVGSAAKLMSYYIYNPNSSVAYVQIFDISGTVTLGTSTPKWSVGIPATSAANLSGLNLNFSNAIKVAATTTAAGSTAPSTALDCNFGYR